MPKINPREALERLREGNRRYVAGDGLSAAGFSAERRRELMAGQFPIAIVLGCLDSRVPPEIVFGQGLGDLLVLRLAGNVATPLVIGSIEMAVEMFGTQLVVVLGHSLCGAIQVTSRELMSPSDSLSPELQAIVKHISPSVEAAADSEARAASNHWMQSAVRANVLASIAVLRDESAALDRLARTRGLRVVGAEYDVESGVVDFFEGVPIED